jgi:hypothetical protein
MFRRNAISRLVECTENSSTPCATGGAAKLATLLVGLLHQQ